MLRIYDQREIKPKTFSDEKVKFESMFLEMQSSKTLKRQFQAAKMSYAISLSLNIEGGFNWLCFYNCSNIHGGNPHLKYVIVFRLQKLTLRNKCTSTTQHLRLLIRGQDQDCFQVCGVYGFMLFYVLSVFRKLTYAGYFVLIIFE